MEFDVSCVASAPQTSDYFLSRCQEPPGTAKGCVVNVKDNVIEKKVSQVVGFVFHREKAFQ